MKRWHIVKAPFGLFLFPAHTQHWPVIAEFTATADEARATLRFLRGEL